MASSVYSAVGLATAEDLSTYDVRTCSRPQSADNKAYVSSQTAGRTFRKAGNLDRSWEISLYAKAAMRDIPAVLQAGKRLKIQIPTGAKSEELIIDSSTLEVDIEAGELLAISISGSAIDDASYPAP